MVGISVAVQQFDAWPGNRASIAVTWRLSFDAGSAEVQLLTCRTQHQKTSLGGYSGLVATQQALMRDVHRHCKQHQNTPVRLTNCAFSTLT